MPEVIDTKRGKSFLMSQHVGTGENVDGTKFKMLTNLNFSPLISFDEGIYVSFSWNELVNIAFEKRQEYLDARFPKQIDYEEQEAILLKESIFADNNMLLLKHLMIELDELAYDAELEGLTNLQQKLEDIKESIKDIYGKKRLEEQNE